MNATDRPVSDLSHDELATEYSQIGDELFYPTEPLSDEERDEAYDRRLELWKEMKSRVNVTLPECPKCGNDGWTQTPGDPKECTSCGYEPLQEDLIENINSAWNTILKNEEG